MNFKNKYEEQKYIERKRRLAFLRSESTLNATPIRDAKNKNKVILMCKCGATVERSFIIPNPICFNCKSESKKARNRSTAERNKKAYLKRKLS